MEKQTTPTEDVQKVITPAAEPAAPTPAAPYAIYVAIGAFLVATIIGMVFLNSKKSLPQTNIPIIIPTQQPAQVDIVPTTQESTFSAGPDEVEDLERDAATIDTSELDDPLLEIDREIKAL